MNPMDRKSQLILDFEHHLGRKLAPVEEDFIKWIVRREIEMSALEKKIELLVL